MINNLFNLSFILALISIPVSAVGFTISSHDTTKLEHLGAMCDAYSAERCAELARLTDGQN